MYLAFQFTIKEVPMQAIKSLVRKASVSVKSTVRFLGRVFVIGALITTLMTVVVAFLAPFALTTGVLMPFSLFVAGIFSLILMTVGSLHFYENVASVLIDRLTSRLPA
jgi:hypothetical protein